MKSFAAALAQVLANPATGDQSDATLKIFIVAGVVCVLAVAALLILPKFLRKDNPKEEQPEIEEISEE